MTTASTITVQLKLRCWVKPAMTVLARVCNVAAHVLPLRWVEAFADRAIRIAVRLGTTTPLCPSTPIDTRTLRDIERADLKNG